MRAARYILACLAVLVLAPAAGAKPAKPKAPSRLHGFLLRADEAAVASFARTPAFAWNPVAGAVKYQFQLATSTPFRENAIVYSAITTTPVAAPTTTLPWINDMLHARVRAMTPTSVTPWSTILNFDMDPPPPPPALSSAPGLLRWAPVEGATAYEVWLIDIPKMETVYTNVLDEREFYTFHRTGNWTGDVRWRIRALRTDNDPQQRKNGLPAVTYGAWSPIYSSSNPGYTGGPITAGSLRTISDVVSTGGQARPQADAGVRVQRRPDARRQERRALPHLRLHGPTVPQPRLHEPCLRRPGVRAPAVRPSQHAHDRRRDHSRAGRLPS